MKKLINLIRTDKIIKWAMYSALTLMVGQLIIITFSFQSLPQFIPLFNQMPWGSDRLGTRIEIFLPVVISFAFLILNISLVGRLYEKLPLVSRILGITTLLITVLSCIFLVRTLYLII